MVCGDPLRRHEAVVGPGGVSDTPCRADGLQHQLLDLLSVGGL